MDSSIAKITSEVKLKQHMKKQQETLLRHSQSIHEMVTNEYELISRADGAIVNAVTPSGVHVSSSFQSVKDAKIKLNEISESISIQQKSLQIELGQYGELLKRNKDLKEQKEFEMRKYKCQLNREELKGLVYTQISRVAQNEIDEYEKESGKALRKTIVSGAVVATGGILLIGAMAAPVTGGLSLAAAIGASLVGSGAAGGGTVSIIKNGVKHAKMKETINRYNLLAFHARLSQNRSQMESDVLEKNLERLNKEIGTIEESITDIQNMLDVYFHFEKILHNVLLRFQESDVALHAAAVETHSFRVIQRAFNRHGNRTRKFDKYMDKLKEKWREMQDVIHFQHKIVDTAVMPDNENS